MEKEREREKERVSGVHEGDGKDARRAGGYRHKGQLKSQSSGPNYVEKRGGARARSRAPIYNKMKAIRGDNPRTTNQRVYLMPVVPPPPPENPRCPTWNSFPSLSLASCSLSLSLSIRLSFSIHLSIYLSLDSSCMHSPPFFLSSSLYLSVFLAYSLSPSLSFSLFITRLVPLATDPPPPAAIPPRSLPRHHVVALGYVTMLPT